MFRKARTWIAVLNKGAIRFEGTLDGTGEQIEDEFQGTQKKVQSVPVPTFEAGDRMHAPRLSPQRNPE
jgi:hypothetical protein